MLRCILINPCERIVSELYIAEGLEGLRYALGADPAFSGMVECVNLGQRENRGVDCWIDEEGNLSEGRKVFSLGPHNFSGACILLDNDGEGGELSTQLSVSRVSEMVEWTNLETTGDFGPPREYTTDHPILGKNCPVFEGGKPIYREGV